MTSYVCPLPKIDFIPFPDIEEKRPVALVTSGPAWEAVKDKLRLPIVWQADVKEATQDAWAKLLKQGFQGEVVYAVGGGLPADAAKYLAFNAGLPMICLPTALSVDAFVTWASGVRIDGCVRYIPTKVPDRLVIDFQVLAAAPPHIRAAGLCDVLSIATGNWDWKFAEERGKNGPGMRYVPYVAKMADAILDGVIDCAPAAGRGDPVGLKQLLDCICLQAQLCNQIGHARPEEGSEHYFAYAIENLVGSGRPHADLVCPGILIMADLQGQNVHRLKQAITACNIPLDTLPLPLIQTTLYSLADYSRKHDLAYGIAHELTAAKARDYKIKL